MSSKRMNSVCCVTVNNNQLFELNVKWKLQVTRSTHNPLLHKWKYVQNLKETLPWISHTVTWCQVETVEQFVNNFQKLIQLFSLHWRQIDLSDIVSTVIVQSIKNAVQEEEIKFYLQNCRLQHRWNILLVETLNV